MRTSALLLALSLIACDALAQPLETATRVLELGTIVGDDPAERAFTVVNHGSSPVRIHNVQLTPPLSVVRMKSVMAPGESSDIVVRLGIPRPAGRFDGQLAVNFEDDEESLVVDVSATLVPLIEFRPRAELLAVTEAGVEARDSIEIINHAKDPLVLMGGKESNERFSTSLESLEAGRRYRLSLVLSGRGKTGRQTDTVALKTGDPERPELRVRVRTMVHNRVYAFPDAIDFGRVALASTRPDQIGLFDTSVMVYQKGGQDFQIKISTDVPFLVVRPEKSTKFGDRWQIFCSIDPSRLTAGHVSGSLTIETNDTEFPRLTVPIEAVVE